MLGGQDAGALRGLDGRHDDEIEPAGQETGKSVADAAQEVPLLPMILSYYIKIMDKALAPETRPPPAAAGHEEGHRVYFRPRGLTGIIAPWNYPGGQCTDGCHRCAWQGAPCCSAVRAHSRRPPS